MLIDSGKTLGQLDDAERKVRLEREVAKFKERREVGKIRSLSVSLIGFTHAQHSFVPTPRQASSRAPRTSDVGETLSTAFFAGSVPCVPRRSLVPAVVAKLVHATTRRGQEATASPRGLGGIQRTCSRPTLTGLAISGIDVPASGRRSPPSTWAAVLSPAAAVIEAGNV
ncbi:hypothetical protein AURDEDRAFT_167789 [Auricularia subglabra TFB-10046 SS5]|nr:hypothetical protein AURDEDRAFT_167789 [Auricularia subglabra TFB-10046 SS5]